MFCLWCRSFSGQHAGGQTSSPGPQCLRGLVPGGFLTPPILPAWSRLKAVQTMMSDKELHPRESCSSVQAERTQPARQVCSGAWQ